MVGTPYYLSPEIVQNKPYNFKSDVWAMGVLLYELCALKPPFDGTSLQMLGMRITRGNYTNLPKIFSSSLQSLVKKMLNISTYKRPSVYQILKEDIIQDRIQTFLSKSILKDEFSHTIFHKQQIFAKDGKINKLGANGDGKNMLPIEPKKEDKKVAAPIKNFTPQIEKPRISSGYNNNRPASSVSTPANNYHYNNKNKGGYQVGYNKPNYDAPKPRPKYTPPQISAEEKRRREQKEREREEQRRLAQERDRKEKEAQKQLEKQRLAQWRKDYEEKQKRDYLKKQKEEAERQKEIMRVKEYNMKVAAERKKVEQQQRSNMYHQARLEAELNKKRHLEQERKAANQIFGYYDEDQPKSSNRPSTSGHKRQDKAGDLSNNKKNIQYQKKAYNREPMRSDRPASGMISKHPGSQVPSSYYDPPPKAEKPSSKGPSLEDFFPAKKPLDKIRKPDYKPELKKPPKTTPVQSRVPPTVDHTPKPKPQQQEVAQETIPYNMKNTNQKINALDQLNDLIGDITDMTIMKDDNHPKEEPAYNPPSYKPPAQEDFEKYKQESKGTGIVMSFYEDEKPKKKPMLSSMKKKKRPQWKSNQSVLEPKTNITAFDDAPSEDLGIHRVDSMKTRDEILDSQRKIRNELKKKNKKKKKSKQFECVFVGDQAGVSDYTPPQVEERKVDIPKPEPPKIISTVEKIEAEAPQPKPKRVKKQWKRQEKVTPKAVEDKSQERKQWNKPSEVPNIDAEEEEFEVVHVKQNSEEPVIPPKIAEIVPQNSVETSKSAQPSREVSKVQEIEPVRDSPYYVEPNMAEGYDAEYNQVERMLMDMKMNLLGNITDDGSNLNEMSTDDDSSWTKPKLEKSQREEREDSPEESQDEDRDDFSFEETVLAVEKPKEAEPEVDPEIEKQMKSCTFGGDIAEVMKQEESKYIGEKIDHDLETYNTFDRIKEYLEEEIGEEILTKAHPILKEFGDDILYEKNIPKVVEKLSGIVKEDEVIKYLHFFATLIFFENQKESLSQGKNKKDEQERPQSKKISNQKTKPSFNVQSFKDKPEDEEVDNIFKNYSNQNPAFDATANFGA